MDWEQISTLFEEQISNKLDYEEGFREIQDFLDKNGLPKMTIDHMVLKIEFDRWLKQILESEPIPEKIKSVYFGLMTLLEHDKECTTISIGGSSLTPSEDEDWACELDYEPEDCYLIPTEFQKIDSIVKSNSDLSGIYEVIVFNGILNLLVINAIKDYKDELLSFRKSRLGVFKKEGKRNNLFFGTGYDSGDIFIIGELKK